MSDPGLALLRQTLLARYDTLIRYLTRRLGSADRAAEALQDAYLKLERTNEIEPVRDPEAYLLRMAANLAKVRSRTEQRRSRTEEASVDPNDLGDMFPDPETVAMDRSEINALKRALAELPARQREIVILARVRELSHGEIAERFGVSTRTVRVDLQHAVEYLAKRIGRKAVRRFSLPRRAASSD
jgi:RNA polymerase sigma-70 factor (ECF subfamily)